MSARYIVIPNWETFQHYKDRSPKWIKNYTELLHDEAYRSLSGHQRALLHGIWLEYASSRCHLPLTTSSLSSRLGLRVMTRDLDSLSHAGFIAFSASAPLAPRYPREEKIREETLSKDVTRPDAPKPGTEWAKQREIEEAQERQERGNGWVDDINAYTGCRIVRGEIGATHKYDPLGMDPVPIGWPYKVPTRAEIRAALDEREHAHA